MSGTQFLVREIVPNIKGNYFAAIRKSGVDIVVQLQGTCNFWLKGKKSPHFPARDINHDPVEGYLLFLRNYWALAVDKNSSHYKAKEDNNQLWAGDLSQVEITPLRVANITKAIANTEIPIMVCGVPLLKSKLR